MKCNTSIWVNILMGNRPFAFSCQDVYPDKKMRSKLALAKSRNLFWLKPIYVSIAVRPVNGTAMIW